MKSNTLVGTLIWVALALCLVVASYLRIGKKEEFVPVEVQQVEEPFKRTIPNANLIRLDEYFSRQELHIGFSGVVLVGERNHILYNRAFGLANKRKKIPMTTETPFQLASVSKQFTAVCILQLYERGLLQLTDTLGKFFPELPYKQVTIHQMLVHRSGLPNYHYLFDERVLQTDSSVTNQLLVNRLADRKEPRFFSPNARYMYSNTGYALLAAIVEKVSGLPFEQYLQQNVFQPLAMDSTFAYRALKSQTYPPHATGYLRGRQQAYDNYLDHFLGDKGIYATSADLFRWDQGLYSGKIINPDTLKLAFRPMGKVLTATENYGYGWRLREYNGDSIQYHSGWWHGFKTTLIRVPSRQITIIVLKNHARCGGIGRNQLLNIVLSDAPAPDYTYDELPEDED